MYSNGLFCLKIALLLRGAEQREEREPCLLNNLDFITSLTPVLQVTFSTGQSGVIWKHAGHPTPPFSLTSFPLWGKS